MDRLHFRQRGRQAALHWALGLFFVFSGDPTGPARGCAAEPQPVFPACLQPSFRTLYLPDMGVGHPALLAANSLYASADDPDRRTDGGAAPRRLRGQAGVYSYLGFIPENKKTGLGGALSMGRHSLGLHYEFEGFSLYHKHSAGLSYALAFTDQWQGGVFVRYRRRNRIEDVADKGAVESGLSVACRLEHWDLSFKAAYEIPLQDSGIWQQALSLLLTAAYRLSDDLSIGVEVGKDIRYPVEAAAAVAYRIKGRFMVFGLCGVYPFRFSLGGGYTAPRFDIIVATAYHPPLGATGQISVSWKAW